MAVARWVICKIFLVTNNNPSISSAAPYKVSGISLIEDNVASFQGIVTGTGENSEFGEVFKMMKAEEVSSMHNVLRLTV